MEKSTLPFVAPQPSAARQPTTRHKVIAKALLSAGLLAYFASPWIPTSFSPVPSLGKSALKVLEPQCAQPEPLFPSSQDEKLDGLYDFLSTPAFRNATIARHSGAVKVPTQSFDDLGKIGEDTRWEVMYAFADYLRKTFPRIHSELKLEKVNTHGLLYTWQGSDDSLKPTLLMAHQDVVPVPDATISAWTHPPWSGYFDGEYIWGRGSSDCKDQLIAIMETVELLLETGFKPKRTIVMPFGFDEEISGREGGGHLADFVLERYGENGIAAIVDEGARFEEVWGQLFAKPGVGEKGYTDVEIIVRMPGGHSSIPSDHTGIGVISEIVTAIESEQYQLHLADNNPYLGQLYCGTEHAPDFPSKLADLLSSRAMADTCKGSDHLAIEAAKQGLGIKYLMQTSQAVDVINGGVKVNALPERTAVTVNHRINVGETPKVVWDRLTSITAVVAKKYNLTLHAFDGTTEAASSISLTASETTLNVAPITPTSPDLDTPYGILAGTVRAVYGTDVVVAPGIMTGNTDTRYYWALTKHIFRFGPGFDPKSQDGMGNIHTVDERASVEGHTNAVRWFLLFIRNMDEASLES